MADGGLPWGILTSRNVCAPRAGRLRGAADDWSVDVSRTAPKKTKSKPGAKVRTLADDHADAEEQLALARLLSIPVADAMPLGVGRAPGPRQRAALVAELIDTARQLLRVVDAVTSIETLTGPDGETQTVTMHSTVRTARGRVLACLATVEERHREVARTIVGVADHLGLTHACSDAVDDLTRALLRLPSPNRDGEEWIDREEWLARNALIAAGIDAKTAGRWIDQAAEFRLRHEAGALSTKSL